MMADLLEPVGRFWQLLTLGCLMLAAAPAPAESLDGRLLADAADGTLNEHEFISAALIASGVSDGCELQWWRAAYAELRLSALESLDGIFSNERLAAIQSALHERILVGAYVASASDLRTTIARGDYNCLTALAIHSDLCNQAGLPVEICSQPGHVCLRSATGLTIESGASQHIATLRLSRQTFRRLTPVELLGKFYYNRGVEELRAGRFSAGLALLRVSLQLDPADADARENLLAGLNNWAVEHCRQERYDLAAPLIEQGLSMEPAFAPLVANERLVREKLRQ
jgi:tetratricopeptide (TPR) repeat protein